MFYVYRTGSEQALTLMDNVNKDNLFFRVCISVADLRREKVYSAKTYGKDTLQETQLLFNELVLKLDEDQDWFYVEALEQQKFDKALGKWRGYPGWIQKKHLKEAVSEDLPSVVVHSNWAEIHSVDDHIKNHVSIGTRLPLLNTTSHSVTVLLPDSTKGVIDSSHVTPYISEVRPLILKLARQFLNMPYHWGGRSAYRTMGEQCDVLTSVDCSGLVQLVYRVAGLSPPRDAIDQYRASQHIDAKALLAGDLIFHAPSEKPDAIDHVMIYAGEENLIEATMQHDKVREVSFLEKFGVSLETFKEKGYQGELVPYFGRFHLE